jgi:hypothetical protein
VLRSPSSLCCEVLVRGFVGVLAVTEVSDTEVTEVSVTAGLKF